MDSELERAFQVFLGSAHGGRNQTDSEEHCDDRRAIGAPAQSTKALASGLRSEGFAHIHEYALLPSAKTARWVIPLDLPSRTVSGLGVCVPFERSTRILKRLLVPMARMGWTGWSADRILLASRESLPIESLVYKTTGESNPVFALSLGTPGSFRKLTVQVMRPNGEILGYMKLPLTEEAGGRIRREAATLKQLSSSPALMPQIPKVLYADEWVGDHVLFQSGGPAKPGPIEFGPLCRKFLDKLWDFKRVDKPGSALVEEVAARWREVEAKLDPTWRDLGSAALTKASHGLQNITVACGLTHGDFAPWNTRLLNGELYVFDWESASEEAPRLWDVFHYHVQVGGLLQRRVGTGLEPKCQKSDTSLFLLYLLHSACDCLQENSPNLHRLLDYRRVLLSTQLST